jgi:tRNA threonylcarbamoyladenosine biosynthesis protein TsaE
VVAARKPFEQARLGLRQVDARDCDGLESHFPAPLFDLRGEADAIHLADRGIRLHDPHPGAKLTRHLPDEAATAALGAALATLLVPGLRLYLHGDLGAGKTTLVRGMLRALGYPGKVKSPTYTLVELYKFSRLYLYHFDFFRLEQPLDWLDAGFLEYFSDDAVCVVEWPEKAGGTLPPPDLEIFFDLLPDGRSADLVAASDAGRRCLSAFDPAG